MPSSWSHLPTFNILLPLKIVQRISSDKDGDRTLSSSRRVSHSVWQGLHKITCSICHFDAVCCVQLFNADKSLTISLSADLGRDSGNARQEDTFVHCIKWKPQYNYTHVQEDIFAHCIRWKRQADYKNIYIWNSHPQHPLPNWHFLTKLTHIYIVLCCINRKYLCLLSYLCSHWFT